MEQHNKRIVVIGSGLAGWVSSYMLAATFSRLGVRVTFAESSAIDANQEKICSLDNFSDLLPILDLIGLDRQSFFNQCSAQIYVGYQYVDEERGVDFVQSFSGYTGSGHSKVNEDLIPIMSRILPSLHYQDFSLVAQLAIKNKFYSAEQIAKNEGLLHGVGVNFLEKSFIDILRDRREERFFDHLVYTDLSVERDAFGAKVYIDSALVDADLFIDATGPSGEIISVLSDKLKLDSPACSATQIDGAEGAKLLVQCSYTSNGLSTVRYVNGLSETTTFNTCLDKRLCNSSFLLETPWVANTLAVGQASRNFPCIVYGELDLVINQVKAFIDVFPSTENGLYRRQYYNKASFQKLIWLYRFNCMVFYFNSVVKSEDSSFYAPGLLCSIYERAKVFSKTSFVFTEDNEIFSDVYWKQFFLGSKLPYCGGFSYISTNANYVLDLLKEKISIHQNINQLEKRGLLSRY